MITAAPDDERGVADSAEGATQGAVPDVIYLPDQSQPPARSRRRGRHFGPRPVDDPRSAWLTSRCTPSFLAKVRADAEAAGQSLSDYLHVELGGKRSGRKQKPGPDMILLAQIKAGQGRIGGNLQQLVKRLNSYDFRGQPELLALQELAETTLTEHREASAALMRALGGRSVTDDH
jgi:hypothetical protein